MMHMVQANITKDMKKVNLMGIKPEHDLILKDRKSISPGKNHPFDNYEMEKPIIDVGSAINRASGDPRTQARFLSTVK